MATDNTSTATDNTETRYDAWNNAEQAIAEIHAIGDLLIHSNTENLAAETLPTIGGMLDTIGQRLQRTVGVLYRKEANA